MDNFVIDSTSTTPEINFDFEKNIYVISGESYPENSDEFFRPLFEKLNKLSKIHNNESLKFIFKLVYFNSSSARALMKLFELLDSIAESTDVLIEWYYHEDDDMMEEFGNDFNEDIINANFLLKSYKDE